MRLPGSAPKLSMVSEAMAETLNPRGEPYRMGDITFTPGEWVVIPSVLIERLQMVGWAQIRQQEAP